VLLVEDNDFNQQVATGILALGGVQVTLAENGEEAVNKAKENAFDAVLMDIQMPVMDGYEATRLIRSQATSPSLPIIAMTAHALGNEREKCLAAGMDDYISKPVDPEELFSILGKWTHQPNLAFLVAPTSGSKMDNQESAFPGELPGISIQAGLGYHAESVDLYRKALSRFLDLKPGVASDIKIALGKGDLENAERLAHTMISGAGAIGAQPLASTALDLQNAIIAKETGKWESILTRFDQRLGQVIDGLRLHFEKS
jgi:CheY-like chemotaxis protein